ncbi:IS6 family transposase [Rhizobium beringeri]
MGVDFGDADTRYQLQASPFPPRIVSHAVWLYLRFNLSLREVEEMLLERGIDVSYETVRRWIAKFRTPDRTYLDEVVVKCAGEKFWLWRAVDQHGTVLEEILQKRRDKRAAKRVLVALMKRYGFAPKRIITDKLRAYGAAKAEVAPGLEGLSGISCTGVHNGYEGDHPWHDGKSLSSRTAFWTSFSPVLMRKRLSRATVCSIS